MESFSYYRYMTFEKNPTHHYLCKNRSSVSYSYLGVFGNLDLRTRVLFYLGFHLYL